MLYNSFHVITLYVYICDIWGAKHLSKKLILTNIFLTFQLLNTWMVFGLDNFFFQKIYMLVQWFTLYIVLKDKYKLQWTQF